MTGNIARSSYGWWLARTALQRQHREGLGCLEGMACGAGPWRGQTRLDRGPGDKVQELVAV